MNKYLDISPEVSAALAGEAASAISMEGKETINPDLSVDALRRRAGL